MPTNEQHLLNTLKSSKAIIDTLAITLATGRAASVNITEMQRAGRLLR